LTATQLLTSEYGTNFGNFDVGISKVMVVLPATRIIAGLQLLLLSFGSSSFLFQLTTKIEGNIMAGTQRR
jgi:hypothetical protein